jgi:aspartate oxidase
VHKPPAEDIQTVMWEHAGILRNITGLRNALSSLKSIQTKANHIYSSCLKTVESAELLNLATVASLILQGASSRTKSVGLHYLERTDKKQAVL